MRILFAVMVGFILDLMFGDPKWMYHPVRIIGNLIHGLSRILRRLAGDFKGRQLAAGVVLWIVTAGLTTAVPYALLSLAERIHPVAAFVLESVWCYQILALTSLKEESMKVYDALKQQNTEAARQAVSRIVGRDTKQLQTEGIIKAAVETVAENTSDGIIAPLFYMFIGGAPLAFFYKAVNTMDSMVGYKNDTYFYFGKAAAKLDDLFNFIPARIAAFLMIAGAFFTGLDGRNAFRIFRRDRKMHASPNAAQTESVCAGALGIMLAGNAYYFGELFEKPSIGDARRPVEAEDIPRTCSLMYAAAVGMVLTGSLIRYLIISV